MYMYNFWYTSRLCVSSLRRGHANLLCNVPILSEDYMYMYMYMYVCMYVYTYIMYMYTYMYNVYV